MESEDKQREVAFAHGVGQFGNYFKIILNSQRGSPKMQAKVPHPISR
jgi:hypothetical protein